MNTFTFAHGTEVVLTVNGRAMSFPTDHCELQNEVLRGDDGRMAQRIGLIVDTSSCDPFNPASRRLINDMATELTNGESPKAILGRYREDIIQAAYGTRECPPPKLASDSETIKLLEAKIERLEAENSKLRRAGAKTQALVRGARMGRFPEMPERRSAEQVLADYRLAYDQMRRSCGKTRLQMEEFERLLHDLKHE